MSRKIRTKFCGFTDYQSVEFAVNLGVEFIGFVFHDSSPRNISFAQSKTISQKLSSQISKKFHKVAVFCDADDFKIENITNSLSPSLLQLHGNESPERISQIKEKFSTKIIKTFHVKDKISQAEISENYELADYLLFDSFSEGSKGGTGKIFNWNLLKNKNFSIPWFLSGGLNIDNISEAIKITNTQLIDISSGIEKTRGVKSKKLMKQFVNQK